MIAEIEADQLAALTEHLALSQATVKIGNASAVSCFITSIDAEVDFDENATFRFPRTLECTVKRSDLTGTTFKPSMTFQVSRDDSATFEKYRFDGMRSNEVSIIFSLVSKDKQIETEL